MVQERGGAMVDVKLSNGTLPDTMVYCPRNCEGLVKNSSIIVIDDNSVEESWGTKLLTTPSNISLENAPVNCTGISGPPKKKFKQEDISAPWNSELAILANVDLSSTVRSEKQSPGIKGEKDRQNEQKLLQKVARLKEVEDKRKKTDQDRLQKLAEKEKNKLRRLEKERVREEEKKMKDNEREQERKKREVERKRQKKVEQKFRSFFKSGKVSPKKHFDDDRRFRPFELKAGMTLAPVVRRKLSSTNALDAVLDAESCASTGNLKTHLQELSLLLRGESERSIITRKSIRRDAQSLSRKLKSEGDSDVEITEEIPVLSSSNEKTNLMPVVLLQFSENTRPAYYGTWRKKSKRITGRRPFVMDEQIFDYDIDSDEEWVDEPGESLSDANEDDEGEDEERDEDNDGFFVPHGYLSDDEGIKDSDEEADDFGDIKENGKLRSKLVSIDVELKRKFKPRKSVCIGPVFTNDPRKVSPLLLSYSKVELYCSPAARDGDQDCADVEGSEAAASLITNKKATTGPVKLVVPDEAMPTLIRFVHGNPRGIIKLAKQFKEFWLKYARRHLPAARRNISNRQLERKIQAIAYRSHLPDSGKLGYIVHREVLEKYSISHDLSGFGLPAISTRGACTSTSSSSVRSSAEPSSNFASPLSEQTEQVLEDVSHSGPTG